MTLLAELEEFVRDHRPHGGMTGDATLGWRARFYTTDMEHSPTSATGTGWEPTPWHPTQRGAWRRWPANRPEFRSARLPASHPHEVRMRRIGLAVVLVVSLIL